MQVTVATAKVTVKDEQGREAEGLMLTCSRCGETVEVFGTSNSDLIGEGQQRGGQGEPQCLRSLEIGCPAGILLFRALYGPSSQ
jgi:hypothetical protein